MATFVLRLVLKPHLFSFWLLFSNSLRLCGFYDTSTIYDIFRKCLFDAGIPHRGRGKGPRLHDLRHSFAVHILNKWSSEGKDIYTCLPILRTALGHDRITTTEKYLRLVPEAYMEVTEPFNDRFHTITEVLCNEE
jgi:integrase